MNVDVRHGGRWEPAVDSDPDRLFGVLENPRARTILSAMDDTPVTASELADRCGIPNSTMYRQLGELVDAGLVRKSVRLDRSGHHASEFSRAVSDISISLDEAGLCVDLY